MSEEQSAFEVAGLRVERSESGVSLSGTPEQLAEAVQAVRQKLHNGRPSAPPLDHSIAADAYYPWPSEEAFGGYDYMEAPDLQELGDHLIDVYDVLVDAGQWRIHYLWRREGGSSSGRVTLGKCTKLSGLAAYYSDADFVIWLAADHCYSALMTRRHVEAALFHELCHVATAVSKDGGERPTVKAHDAEVFRAELEEYGLWKADLRFTFGQLEFPLDDEEG